MKTITITVRLNGTSENPWWPMGFMQNPFPQIAKAEYDQGERQIASLDGEPIKDANDIRERLKGFTEEFIEYCIARFKPGERVAFTISFPDRMS